jgi:hypothetical protein
MTLKISREIISESISKSAKIKEDFKIIPKTIEKATNPFLYSFLSGLKKVLSSIDNDMI